MFLLINSLVASLDGLLMGFSLKILKVKLSWKNILIFSFGNLFSYTLVLSFYSYFQLQFMSRIVTTIMYLFLAFLTWKSKEDTQEELTMRSLSFFPCLFLALTHSLDGALVSLSFVYDYSLLIIICCFTIMAVGLFLLGYFCSFPFHYKKKSNIICATLFLLLALFNQFF